MLTNSYNGHWSTIHVTLIFPPFCARAQIFALTRNKKEEKTELRARQVASAEFGYTQTITKFLVPPRSRSPVSLIPGIGGSKVLPGAGGLAKCPGGLTSSRSLETHRHTQCHRKGGLTVEPRENKRAWRQFDIGGPQSGKSASPHL